MLENLKPATKPQPTPFGKPGVIWDGTEGEATTPYDSQPASFEEFIAAAGMDADLYEVVGTPRISKWQQKEGGDYLTSFRFTFRLKQSSIDLPLLYAAAKRTKPQEVKTKTTNKALVILWSDLQVGKVDHRGNSQSLIDRVQLMQSRIVEMLKQHKPERVVFVDLGDTVEGFDNTGGNQLQSNDLSPMQQFDLAMTMAWETLKLISKHVPKITYASVGSNHCQWRVNGKRQGTPQDDWGIQIARTLARLSQEVGLGIQFVTPQEHDESLALDVFDDNYHILGIWHGHQASRPDGVPTWWRQQAFGQQPVANATIGVSGHFHHLRVQELGSTPRGTSRYWIQASTLDNGSNWWRLNAGEDSQPGLVTFILEQNKDFMGTVYKL